MNDTIAKIKAYWTDPAIASGDLDNALLAATARKDINILLAEVDSAMATNEAMSDLIKTVIARRGLGHPLTCGFANGEPCDCGYDIWFAAARAVIHH